MGELEKILKRLGYDEDEELWLIRELELKNTLDEMGLPPADSGTPVEPGLIDGSTRGSEE